MAMRRIKESISLVESGQWGSVGWGPWVLVFPKSRWLQRLNRRHAPAASFCAARKSVARLSGFLAWVRSII